MRVEDDSVGRRGGVVATSSVERGEMQPLIQQSEAQSVSSMQRQTENLEQIELQEQSDPRGEEAEMTVT